MRSRSLKNTWRSLYRLISLFLGICGSKSLLLWNAASRTAYIGTKTQTLFSVPPEIQNGIRVAATTIWGPEQLNHVTDSKNKSDDPIFGEAAFEGLEYSKRLEIFEKRALAGDPQAQHSLGLLLWSGFCGSRNDIESARWHAAAAFQNHLDGMAVLGGCLRTGTGTQLNEKLGLRLIRYVADQGNPTGINKLATMEESDGNYVSAFSMYENCEAPNALLWMNIGFCYLQGQGTRKNEMKALEAFKNAFNLAPDEGSEEAAWFLYQYFERDDPKEASKWLEISACLGYPDAIELI